MSRPRQTNDHQKICRFLSKISYENWERLERIGPELVWVLRNHYGPGGSSMEQLALRCPWSSTHVQRLREQALHLLGYSGELPDREIKRIGIRIAELELRSKLHFLSTSAELVTGDQEVLTLVMSYGAFPKEIERNSRWKEAEVIAVFKRLTQAEQFKMIELGGKVRIAALREVSEGKRNPKADLELEILQALRQGSSLSTLAEEWETSHTNLDSVVAEIRRELAASAETKKRFLQLQEESRRIKGLSALQIHWLNSMLLPLYRKFRKGNKPFSTREKRYLRHRCYGRSIGYSAKKSLKVNLIHGSVIDRALLGYIPSPIIELPEKLSLPPFTDVQRSMMDEIRYCPV